MSLEGWTYVGYGAAVLGAVALVILLARLMRRRPPK